MKGLAIDVAAWASPWRHRSPGDKVLLAFGLVLCALLLPVWPGCLIVTVVAVGLALGPAGVNGRVFARAARGALAFITLAGLSIALTWQPDPDAGWELTVTGASAVVAARTSAHAIAGTAAMLLLATTTPISDLLGWAHRRGLPDVVTDIAGLTYRLLFVLLDTSNEVLAAQAARLGYATRRAGLRSAAMLASVVLTRAWTRARRLEDGLTGRGLDGALRVLDEPRPSSPRFVLAAIVVLAAVCALSLTGSAMDPSAHRAWGTGFLLNLIRIGDPR